MERFEYFAVLLATVIGPLVLSRSSALSFYKKPLRLIAAIGLPFPLFVLWDALATQRGHWNFNPEYITGLFIGNLPVEEIVFFIVVPFAALFTWECVKYFSEHRP